MNNTSPRTTFQEVNKSKGVTRLSAPPPPKPANLIAEWFKRNKGAFHKAYLISLYIIEISLLVVEIILLIVHFTG